MSENERRLAEKKSGEWRTSPAHATRHPSRCRRHAGECACLDRSRPCCRTQSLRHQICTVRTITSNGALRGILACHPSCALKTQAALCESPPGQPHQPRMSPISRHPIRRSPIPTLYCWPYPCCVHLDLSAHKSSCCQAVRNYTHTKSSLTDVLRCTSS